MSTRDKLIEARNLIRAKHYDEARSILMSIDHELADKWLDMLDRIAPTSLWDKPGTKRTGKAREEWFTANYASQVYHGPEEVETSALPVTGVIILTIFAITGGVGLGMALFVSSQVLYITLVSVALAAIAAALVMRAGVRAGKVRDGVAAMLFSVVLALALYGSFRYAEYLNYRYEEFSALEDDFPLTGDDELNAIIDEELREQTGSSGLFGFLQFQAQQGTELITSDRMPQADANNSIDASGTYVLWGLEVLLLIVIPPVMAFGATRHPYCNSTRAWLEFSRIGWVPREQQKAFLELVAEGDFRHANEMIRVGKAGRGRVLHVEVGRCHEHAQTGLVRIYAGRELVVKREITQWEYNALVHQL